MEIDTIQHSDFIWTWKNNKRSGKVSLWLPYFQSIERLPKGKSDRYMFHFNGGTVTVHLKELDFIMLYGATGSLPVAFLDKLATYKIPLMIHRRNMPSPYLFNLTSAESQIDVLTNQILYRENQIRRIYIARTLIEKRLSAMGQTIAVPETSYERLRKARSLQLVRNIEAQTTRRYWREYYNSLGLGNLSRREDKHLVNTALDACSYFLFGVLLRWITFHKLSPQHAYLHEPITYPSLCYDLMEPYRHWFENAVKDAYLKSKDREDITGLAFTLLKEQLEQDVYVPATRQTVTKKNLLHGSVLALRSYLLGESKRLILPTEGTKKGGRPLKVAYKLPGTR